MKVLITKATGRFADYGSVGKVHLVGAIDGTACGLDDEDYELKSTKKK